MTRFTVHVRPSDADEHARRSLAWRYPEIEVVSIRRRPDGGEDWICDAPNLTHVERWVTEQRVAVALDGSWVEPAAEDGTR